MSQPTPQLAAQPTAPSPADLQARYCVFSLGEYHFALSGASVSQVFNIERLTQVPRSGSSLLGVFAIQGRVLGLIDLRELLGLGTQEDLKMHSSKPDLAVIVRAYSAREGETQVGLAVDAVLGFNRLEPAAKEVPSELQPFVKANGTHNGKTVFILDIDAALAASREHVR